MLSTGCVYTRHGGVCFPSDSEEVRPLTFNLAWGHARRNLHMPPCHQDEDGYVPAPLNCKLQDGMMPLETARMRALCKEAGGSDYARRVMRLLRTNLLSFSDLAPWYRVPPQRGFLLSYAPLRTVTGCPGPE